MTAEFPPLIPTEDFWSRQANAQKHSLACAPYGISTTIASNHAGILTAAQLSARRYSQANEAGGQPIRMQIVIRQESSAPPPADLADRLVYSGSGDWITLSAGDWGHGFAQLHTREVCIFLSPSLAADVRFVSRYFIDHYVLNLILAEWAMLHASCVIDPGGRDLIVMVATHNTGKSTTALRLVRAGYTFLADGMALLKFDGETPIVGGYPIGEVKLRDDALASFPEYAGQTVRVREQNKTVIDLRAAHPDRVAESLVTPASIHICFVERQASPHTYLDPINAGEVLPILAGHTVYWNAESALGHNTAALHHLLQIAKLYRLRIGSDADNLIAAIDGLSRRA